MGYRDLTKELVHNRTDFLHICLAMWVVKNPVEIQAGSIPEYFLKSRFAASSLKISPAKQRLKAKHNPEIKYSFRKRPAARSFQESIESIFMSWSVREILPGPVPSEINKKGVSYMFVL